MSYICYAGNYELAKRNIVAIVGTRDPSDYSLEMTNKLVRSLIKGNVSICSGGALGIDIEACKASIENHIAVLPNLNIMYPKENTAILTTVKKKGLVFSLNDVNKPITKKDFLDRNKIIAEKSDIMIMVEGNLNSGTQNAVIHMLRLNKPVWVIPQRLGESELTHHLLSKNKAKLITNLDITFDDLK